MKTLGKAGCAADPSDAAAGTPGQVAQQSQCAPAAAPKKMQLMMKPAAAPKATAKATGVKRALPEGVREIVYWRSNGKPFKVWRTQDGKSHRSLKRLFGERSA